MYRIATIITLCALMSACGDEAGNGSLRLTTYGEDFIEEEIPSGAGGAEGFTDGYSLKFSTFLVAFSALKVAHGDGAVAGEVSGPLVFDMHLKGPHLIQHLDGVEARRWDRVGISIKPASGASAGNTVSAADLKLLNDGGYSVYVAGTATKGTASVAFKWGFTTSTSYSDCQEKTHGEGIVVPTGGSATAEFTVHGDHLFYDDLQSSDPSLRFEAVAKADADKDGEVTLEELAKVDLTTLPVGQYGTGGSGTVKNLRHFIEALSRTLIHYQGEGHCHSGS